MSRDLHVLLLIGSAKQGPSTSEVLGGYLADRLGEHGAALETLYLHRAILTPEQQEVFLAAANWADLIVLSFPLYMDSPPYLVIRAMELIAEHRPRRLSFKTQRLCCIANCDLQAEQADSAIDICRRFATENDLEWAGGLGLGQARIINGQPLAKLGRRAQGVMHPLDLAAEALASGHSIPDEARVLMSKPLVRAWMYTRNANREWKRIAKQNGIDDLEAKP